MSNKKKLIKKKRDVQHKKLKFLKIFMGLIQRNGAVISDNF
jgi:hypothetical protein